MELTTLFNSRRSTRAYKEMPALTTELLEQILEEARLAPSWKNTQTARCYAAISEEKMAAVKAALPSFNQESTRNAAAYLVLTYKRNTAGFTAGTADNEAGNEWGAYDLGLFTSYLLLCAKNHGLDSLIMGLRDGDALRNIFSISDDEQVMSVIALGQQDGDSVFKPRKSVGDFAVFG